MSGDRCARLRAGAEAFGAVFVARAAGCRLAAVFGGGDDVTLVAQNFGEHFAERIVVVDNERYGQLGAIRIDHAWVRTGIL